MLSLVLVALLSAGDPFIATACVTRAAPGEPKLETVRKALQARVLKRRIRVTQCDAAKADWRIVLENPERNVLELDVSGLHVARTERVDLTGLTDIEAVQVTALAAAEAIRPAVDRLVLELGDAAKADDSAEADWAERPSTEQPRVVEEFRVDPTPVESRPARRPIGAGILGGVMLDNERQVFGYGELNAAFPVVDALAITGHAGFAGTGSHERFGRDVSRQSYQLGLGAEWTFGDLSVGAQGRVRWLSAHVRGGGEDVSEVAHTVGLGVTARYAVWRSQRFELGLAAQGWYWPAPNRLRYDGNRVLTEGFLEVLLGPTFRVLFP